MEQLLEDYQRRLETINMSIEHINTYSLENGLRLLTKASCYRTFISELEREMRLQKEEIKSETSFGK